MTECDTITDAGVFFQSSPSIFVY